MKKVYSFTALLAALMLLNSVFTISQQTSIRLIDPQGMSRTDKATMDSLTIILKPEGAYTQVSYMINISTKNTKFQNFKDTVEIESYMKLPQNAIINDSWLWVEDTLVYADLIDRWTASKIYEDIVKRFRRDPSLFFKNSAIDYEFRLFPLVGAGNYRKFLISMMVPNTIAGNKFVVQVPDIWFDLVNKPQNVSVIFLNDNKYSNVVYPYDFESSPFTAKTDKFFGDHLQSNLNMTKFTQNKKFEFEGTINEGIHLSKYSVGNEKYFQLTMNSNNLIPDKQSAKHLYIIEHVEGSAILTLSNTISSLFNKISEIYTDGDYVNVMYANKLGNSVLMSPDWIEMNNAGKAKLMASAEDIIKNAANFAMLPLLINSGIDYVNSKPDSLQSIVLVASSGTFGDYQTANTILFNTVQKTKSNTKYFIIDYAKKNVVLNKIGGINYSGNEYLYENLSRLTKGEFQKVWAYSNSIIALLQNYRSIIFTYPQNLDYFITTNDGFAYNYYEVLNTENTFTLVGKYVGGDDFNIRLTYLLGSEPMYKIFNIKSDDIENCLKLPQIWKGNHLKYLESLPNPNNRMITDIIDMSMSSRILSRYTAFLALEPWMRDSLFGGNNNQDKPDGGGGATTVSEDLVNMINGFEISTYPNPAKENSTITIHSPSSVNIQLVEIYDMTGAVIRKIYLSENAIKGDFDVHWDLTDDFGNKVVNGTYFVIINSGFKSYSAKIIVQR